MEAGAAASPQTISVMVPSWRRPDSLRRCLDALEAQTRPPDELVLSVRVDDEETRSMLAAADPPFPLVVATPQRTGVIAALNAGFDSARGDLVAVTDDDTAPHADWLARIEARFREDPSLGGLGGRDLIIAGNDDGGGEPVVGRILWFGRVVGNHHLGGGGLREVDVLKGADMALRGSALAGLRLDPAFRGSGAEHHWEIDLSLALKAAGWRLAYDPAVRVDHYEERRHGGQREELMSPQERFDAAHNQAYALLKHLPPGRRAVAVGYGLLAGTRADPGPVLALLLIVTGKPPKDVAGRLRVATAARLAAFRSWWRWRRARP
jgi:GT2 family glycosyltransferase